MKPNKISFIVCTNGYGHFKRVTNVAANIIKKYSEVQIDIYCAAFHLENTKDWTDTMLLSGSPSVNFYTAPMDNAPVWDSSYTFAEYTDWKNKLASVPGLMAANLVISDNYTAPVALFPNVILMGSFLWHDIFKGGANADILGFEEKSLLSCAVRPPMICVKDMAMPDVINSTNPVLLPWFCEREKTGVAQRANTGNILITGGGTIASDELLINVLKELNNRAGYHLYTDSKLFVKAGGAGIAVNKFQYTDEAFSQLDMLVCRPGIGILTDAVKYGVPVVCLAEAGNPEMEFNSARVAELGIGKNMMGFTAGEIVAGIHEMYTNNELQGMRMNNAGLATGGAADAADYIYSQL